MANDYALKPVTKIQAPNGTKITIWSDNTTKYILLNNIAKALGYTRWIINESLLGLVFKDHNLNLYQKNYNNHSSYVVKLDDVISILKKFIKLSYLPARTKPQQQIRDDARMEAERLIELFNTQIFGKPSTTTVKKVDETTKESTTVGLGETASEFQSTTVKASHDYETYLDLLEQKQKSGGCLSDVESHQLLTARPYTNDASEKVGDLIFGKTYSYISQELGKFLEEKTLYIHKQEPKELIRGTNYWTDLLPPIEEKLGVLEKEFSTNQIIEVINQQVPINQKFRIALIKMMCRGFTDIYRYEQAQKLIFMIREELKPTVITKEDPQMENNTSAVPVVTVTDFDDINERAEAIARVFGVALKDALRAAVILKSQENNRDLAPILELTA